MVEVCVRLNIQYADVLQAQQWTFYKTPGALGTVTAKLQDDDKNYVILLGRRYSQVMIFYIFFVKSKYTERNN